MLVATLTAIATLVKDSAALALAALAGAALAAARLLWGFVGWIRKVVLFGDLELVGSKEVVYLAYIEMS
jgi:hypothetical protein